MSAATGETAPQSRNTLKAAPPGRLKRARASLIGGIAVGIGVAILTVLLAEGLSTGHVALGVAIGAIVGTWVRLADL